MKTQWVLLVGLPAVLVLGCLAVQADQTLDQEAEKDAQLFIGQLRSKFKLPKMFDFERFKSNFKKHYSSALEEMVRAKLYMARAYRAFISAVKYKYRTSPYYLSLNSRADKTQKELDGAINHALEHDLDGLELEPEPVEKPGSEDETLGPLVDPADIWDELERIHKHKNEPGYKELDAELAKKQPAASSRRKREADSCRLEPRAGFDLSAAYERKMSINRGTLGGRIASNNANYEPQDVATEMSFKELEKLPGWRPVPMSDVHSNKQARDYKNLPVKSKHTFRNKPYVVSLTQEFVSNSKKLWRASKRLHDSEDDPAARPGESGESYDARDSEAKPDVVLVDHRQGPCLQPVQEQGDCGSCWAFATIAFFEWAYCHETGSPVKFSEQYLMDCGSARMNALDGCDGGHYFVVAPFVHNFGLELARHYPYKARKEECPYDKKTEPQKMGYMRVEAAEIKRIPLKLFEDYLPNMPLIISIHARLDFDYYGGGVYDGRHCNDEGGHVVLLVGHGREDGEEYWLIRNSYSSDWGEQGYMKLNKNSNCIRQGKGMVFGHLIDHRIHVYPQRNRRVPKPVHKSVKAAASANAKLKSKGEAFGMDMQKRLEREGRNNA